MIRHHLLRLRRQLGRTHRLGQRDFRSAGFHPDRLAIDDRGHEAHLAGPLSRALAARQGAFWDVGANLGQTLLKLLSIDPDRTYFGFEPQIGCCFYLEAFIRQNGLRNCQVLPLALADYSGFIQLHSGSRTDEMATTVKGHLGRTDLRTTHVAVMTGDEVARSLPNQEVGILKIDVESAELSVLRGCGSLIETQAPVVFFEMLPNFVGDDRRFLPEETCERNRRAAAEIFEFLDSRGYRVHQIDMEGREAPVGGFNLDDPGAYVSSDFVAWPG